LLRPRAELQRVHLIAYDLRRPGQQYAALHEAIKGLGAWWHYLDSTWLVDTALNAHQIWEHLATHVDRNDRVMVIRVSLDYQGWMPKEAWDWIQARITS